MVARLTGGQEAAGSSPVIPRQKEFFPFGENSFCMNSYEKEVVGYRTKRVDGNRSTAR